MTDDKTTWIESRLMQHFGHITSTEQAILRALLNTAWSQGFIAGQLKAVEHCNAMLDEINLTGENHET